jgi:heat shock protein HtpX
MLERFRPEEIRAVLGHEIGHVANGDMVTLALIQGVVNTFVMFFARIAGYLVDSFLRRGEDNGGVGIGYYLTTFVFEIIFGVLASMIVAWFSRRREFRADEAGARLADSRGMIAALQHLKAEYGVPDQLEGQLTAFGISSHTKQGLLALFSSHPPLDERIAHLQQLGR